MKFWFILNYFIKRISLRKALSFSTQASQAINIWKASSNFGVQIGSRKVKFFLATFQSFETSNYFKLIYRLNQFGKSWNFSKQAFKAMKFGIISGCIIDRIVLRKA